MPWAKYRKLPVVIEAIRWDAGTDTLKAVQNIALDRGAHKEADGSLSIVTLEGVMRANVGDWVICGVNGEIYPCKPDIFEATYETAAT